MFLFLSYQEAYEHTTYSCEDMERSGYSCEKCGRRYSLKASLLRHVKLECGKAPQFQCPYCWMKTTRNSSLKKHIRIRHPEVLL